MTDQQYEKEIKRFRKLYKKNPTWSRKNMLNEKTYKRVVEEGDNDERKNNQTTNKGGDTDRPI